MTIPNHKEYNDKPYYHQMRGRGTPSRESLKLVALIAPLVAAVVALDVLVAGSATNGSVCIACASPTVDRLAVTVCVPSATL